ARHASPATPPRNRLTRNRRGPEATAFHTAKEFHDSLLQLQSLVALLECVRDRLSTRRKLREEPPIGRTKERLRFLRSGRLSVRFSRPEHTRVARQLAKHPHFTHQPAGKMFSCGLKSDNACFCHLNALAVMP